MDTSPRHDNADILPDSNEENCSQYKGIRMRKWGKWVSEMRMPKSRAKIWLGSYDTAEQAARAYDAAVYCLRGPNTQFNFPNSIPAIPSASSLSRQQIQVAAAKYALGQMPSNSDNNNNISVLTGDSRSPLRSSSVSEMKTSSDGQMISEDKDRALWESLFGDFEGNERLDLERIPSPEPATLNLTSPTQEDGNIFFQPGDLWN